MPVVWLQWREPTDNLGILVGIIEVGVETIPCVATVGIVVAEVDRVHIGSVGHDALFKILAQGRSCAAIW